MRNLNKLNAVKDYLIDLNKEIENEKENRRKGKLALLVSERETQLKQDILEYLIEVLEVE